MSVVRSVLAALVAGLFSLGAGAAHAQDCTTVASNLVANCGFEDGDHSDATIFPSWVVIPAADSGTNLLVAGSPHSGTWAANFGAYIGDDDTITQTLPGTVNGQTYQFSFWVQGDSLGDGSHNDLSASWNGTQLISIVNNFSSGYVEETFSVLATGNDTISFSGADLSTSETGGYLQLDDVCVAISGCASSVPEPATLVLLGAGILGLGVVRRRR